MNEIIEQIYQSGVVEDDQGNKYPHKGSAVACDSGSILYNLIREYKPQKTLEIGLAYGLSTLFICQALSDNGQGSHTAIDPYEEEVYQSIGLLNLERAELRDFLEFYQQPSQQVLAELNGKNEAFDFVFIDGSHLFDYVIVDFFFVDKMLTINGLVVFDDLWMPSVRKAVSYVLQNRTYKLIKPSLGTTSSWATSLGRIGRRFLQNPMGRDWKLKWVPQNVAILQKTDKDQREWTYHRKF